jgi:hypothetical protein
MKSQSFRDQFVLYLTFSRPLIEDEFDRLMEQLWGGQSPAEGLHYLKEFDEEAGDREQSETRGSLLFSTFNEVILTRRHVIEKVVKNSLRK